MKYEFSYNGKVIPYEIIYKKVKNINIRVKPSGEVVVSCNTGVDNKTIELQMIKRAGWLISLIEKYKVNSIEFRNIEPKFLNGEAFVLFGRVLRIKNIQSDDFKVEHDNNYLYIYRNTNKGIKVKFNEWYKKFVLENFNEQVESIYQKFSKYGMDKPSVFYKNMKTRWGSCNIDKKIITLNLHLAKVDKFLTEYVICHELTHFIYRNHSNDFYSFLTSIIPDWKQREMMLNNIFINNLGGKHNDIQGRYSKSFMECSRKF